MNRRKAISSIILAGLGGGIIFSGYKWHDWHRSPDISWLRQQKRLLSALAETILPATDTPGATHARIDDYIITMISDCTDRVSANRFIEGLKELDHYSRSKFGKPYEQCPPADQRSILGRFEAKARPFTNLLGKVENIYIGKPFFTTLKKYTVEGFCTSEIGATKALSYLYIPGQYHGCTPMQAGQKTWAIR
jgi:hypothetical protein